MEQNPKDIKKALYPCDLHVHTTRSDGNDTYPELITSAAEAGLCVIAVTDHDVLPALDLNGQSVHDLALDAGIALLPGCEFSCETEIDDCHIKVIGGNWGDAAMRRIVDDIAASKSGSYLELLDILKGKGMPIDLEELLVFGNPIAVEDLQKKRIFEFMAYKGYTRDWVSAKLMVRDDPELSVKRKKPAAASVIRAAHASGGVVCLAHPFLMDPEIQSEGQQISRQEWIEVLIREGLQGIEASYTYDKTTTREPYTKEEIADRIRETYGGRIFIDGGSDYHADHKKGVTDPRRLGECGLSLDEFFTTPYADLLTPAQCSLLECKRK
ncbi:MAG: PHP domain-containing protein [Eubacteriales bacterium]|nr:PHP domain-containing protein [Eubacteriales bacterium]